jgi:hypothetical protein
MIFIGEKNAEQTYSRWEVIKDSSLTFIPGSSLASGWTGLKVLPKPGNSPKYTRLTDDKTVRSLRVDYTGNFGSVSHCEEIYMCLQRNPHRRITEKLPYIPDIDKLQSVINRHCIMELIYVSMFLMFLRCD